MDNSKILKKLGIKPNILRAGLNVGFFVAGVVLFAFSNPDIGNGNSIFRVILAGLCFSVAYLMLPLKDKEKRLFKISVHILFFIAICYGIVWFGNYESKEFGFIEILFVLFVAAVCIYISYCVVSFTCSIYRVMLRFLTSDTLETATEFTDGLNKKFKVFKKFISGVVALITSVLPILMALSLVH